MTGRTIIVLQVIGNVNKVCVVDCCAVTVHTPGRRGDLSRVILGCMGAEITGDTAVTLATITGSRTGQLGGVVVTDVAVVVLHVVSRIDKGRIIDRCAVTAGTTGR